MDMTWLTDVSMVWGGMITVWILVDRALDYMKGSGNHKE